MLTNLEFLEGFLVKSACCLIFTFLLCFLSIKKYILYVNKHGNLFQPIRDDGPQTHKQKNKTPTMGGFFILISTIISTLLFADLHNYYILIVLFVFISFGAIGLTDDLMKVLYNNCKGFKGSFKIVIQFAIIGATYLALINLENIHLSGTIFLPINSGYYITIGALLYVIFVSFVIVGASNGVNLTDGLDGLVSVPAIINIICLSFLTFIASCPILSQNYKMPYIENAQEILFFCISLIGAILAFLKFNLKPAKIFMGDVGSLAIGAVLGLIAVILKQEFIFFFISLLFVIESLSVILQVGSFKLRKKRIFLMAPIHHHFEKLGWSEQKVVKGFWLASLTFAVLGMAIIYVL